MLFHRPVVLTGGLNRHTAWPDLPIKINSIGGKIFLIVLGVESRNPKALCKRNTTTQPICVEVEIRCRLIQEGGVGAREVRARTAKGQEAVKKAD